MTAWFAALFTLARSEYLDFGYQRFDLGNMVQAVWSTAQGHPLEVTLGTGDQAVRLASHVDPILVLLAPLWILAPTPLSLIAFQIGACALGALPVFWLGRRHLASDKAAALLALAYLAYPWLVWTSLDAFHAVTLAIPLFLLGIWFLDSGRPILFGVCAVLAAATGELMGLPIAFLGLWYWHTHRSRLVGPAVALAGLLWTVIAIKIIVPASSGADSQFHAYYTEVGGSPEGVLRTAFVEPRVIAIALFTSSDLAYWFVLALPLAGAFLLSPTLAAAALPQLAANGLSSIKDMTLPTSHHVAAVIPFLVAASVYGLARLPKQRHAQAALAVLALCTASSALVGPWPGAPAKPREWFHPWWGGAPSEDHIEALREAIALVPTESPVSATNKAGSFLSARRQIFSVPIVSSAEWIVIDELDPWVPIAPRGSRTRWGRPDPALISAFAARKAQSPEWRKVFDRSDILVFQRVQRLVQRSG
jgi:uncharacterized membrane protein